jgi:hypothetical protein
MTQWFPKLQSWLPKSIYLWPNGKEMNEKRRRVAHNPIQVPKMQTYSHKPKSTHNNWLKFIHILTHIIDLIFIYIFAMEDVANN